MIRFIFNNSLLLLSIVADVTSVYIAYSLVSGEGKLHEQGRLGIFFIGIFAIFFFIQNAYLKIIWRRKKRYAKAFSLINVGFAELHELERIKDPNADRKIHTLEKMLDSIVQTFQQITSHECSACIKVMTQEDSGKRPEVVTISRDSASKHKRPTHPKDEISHYVDMNTDFSVICEEIADPLKRYFFCNNLPWFDGYLNTRFSSKREIPFRNYPLLGFIMKLSTWPLQYRSTIVVPILPGYFQTNSPQLAGFLCVDSKSLYAFDKAYDIHILQGISDGMYNVILEYHISLSSMDGA